MTTSTASLSLTASRVLSGLLPVVGLAPWLAGQILYPSDDPGWQDVAQRSELRQRAGRQDHAAGLLHDRR